ncbi:MAG: hypothetical protein CVU39_22620 [Chloroflexi bacterium HGW-Chloroflexi-10]|nr:MAG: hypothetical protein CVU39_22620 [Chloroflexi bacterium HGW-Chloroflexi-10]
MRAMMKRIKSILKYMGMGVLLCVFSLVLFSTFGKLRPGQQMSNQPGEQPNQTSYPPPVESTSNKLAYPPPIESTYTPPPEVIETETQPIIVRTITPIPIPAYPTLTLRPGESPTLIPIVSPEKDASGKIIFAANSKDEEAVAFYSLGTSADGETIDSETKLSEEKLMSDVIIFPSPDGSRLAVTSPWGLLSIFDTQKGIYEDTQLSLGSDGIFFNWFPDNNHILFSSISLAFMDTASGELTALAVPGYGGITGAAASPDGQYVVYGYSSNIVYETGVWMVNTNGQNRQLLLKGKSPYNISWSPNGNKIVLLANGWQIINSDGSEPINISSEIILPQCYSHTPIWSPDSTTLAFVISKTGTSFCQGWTDELFDGTDIMLIDAESGKAKPLLSDGVLGNIDPVWSPDGSQLAFVSNRSGTPEIWIANRDGSNLRQATMNDVDERFIVWRKSN